MRSVQISVILTRMYKSSSGRLLDRVFWVGGGGGGGGIWKSRWKKTSLMAPSFGCDSATLFSHQQENRKASFYYTERRKSNIWEVRQVTQAVLADRGEKGGVSAGANPDEGYMRWFSSLIFHLMWEEGCENIVH